MATGTGKRIRSRRRPRRRRLAPEARRNELLEAALEVLRAAGPQHVRVEDVTRAAGAAKGTFYVYFDSWDDLLVAVRQHVLATYAAAVRTRIGAAPLETWSAIERECVHAVDFIVELGEVHEAIFHGSTEDVAIPPASSAVTLVAQLLEAGISAGVCRPVATDLAAPLLFSVVHETADGIARSGSREAKIETMLDLLRAWLRA